VVLSAHGEFDPFHPLEAHLRLSRGGKLYGLPIGKRPCVSELKLRAEELCLLSCMSGTTESGPGEEMLGIVWGWMSLE